MTTYLWTLDTPWAKKGDTAEITDHCWVSGVWLGHQHVGKQILLDLGWIKFVEEKGKLTAEEILGKITQYVDSLGNCYVSGRKLAAFLAEHLK
jgi:hypothetical protein